MFLSRVKKRFGETKSQSCNGTLFTLICELRQGQNGAFNISETRGSLNAIRHFSKRYRCSSLKSFLNQLNGTQDLLTRNPRSEPLGIEPRRLGVNIGITTNSIVGCPNRLTLSYNDFCSYKTITSKRFTLKRHHRDFAHLSATIKVTVTTSFCRDSDRIMLCGPSNENPLRNLLQNLSSSWPISSWRQFLYNNNLVLTINKKTLQKDTESLF